MSDLKLSTYDQETLVTMRDAGEQVRECWRVLGKANANIVGEVLKGQGEFLQWDHYPKGDVYDPETHSQYYYHAHPPETREAVYGFEHGHFHTFVRPKGMPSGVKPARVKDYKRPREANAALTHLVAISMDRKGLPIRLFTTNRWVTGEYWYSASDVRRILDVFEMDHAYPSWPVNIWITAMMRLFRPQIERLIDERDAKIREWNKTRKPKNVFEDRNLEVTSLCDIDVDEQMGQIDAALAEKTSAA